MGTTAQLKESKDFLESKLAGFRPELAIITGSGLGGIAGQWLRAVLGATQRCRAMTGVVQPRSSRTSASASRSERPAAVTTSSAGR